jgi:integrase
VEQFPSGSDRRPIGSSQQSLKRLFNLANNGVDTRTIQAYLGHRNIMHTVRYTQLAPDRFRALWRD